ncbi:MAG: tetratricopeptide repeat protein [Planctomycetes bacterium]|nr:tetratricopeptide repeat protein [Planctomycetota bacterium]
MKHFQLHFLIIVITSGCSALPQIKRPFVNTKTPKVSSGSPISQLGVALPAMKPGDNRELKIIAADQMSKHGFWSDAVDLYLQAEAMAPKKPKLDAQLAPAFAGAGQFPESIQRYRHLLKEDSRNVALISNLAYTMMESKDVMSAETEFRHALAIDPNYENARVNLGLMLARQGRKEEALSLLIPAIGESAAHYNLGVIAIDSGDDSTARQEFLLAASFPNTPKVTHEFLIALSDSGGDLR